MAEKAFDGNSIQRVETYGDGTHALVVKVMNGGAASSGAGTVTETNWAITYGYNASGQIASETRTDGTVTQTRAYTFDAAGNLTGIGAWA